MVAEGEGAFYAPKIDVHVKDAIGRRWQLSTLQVDLQLPGRFDLEYQAADGSRQRPYMIHRALFGSIERFFGILLEHYAGAFPPWLAPVQVVGIPIADAHVPYLEEVAARLREQRHPGRGRRRATTGCRRRSATRSGRRCRSCCSPATTTWPPGRCRSATATATQKNGVPVDEAVAEIVAAVARPRPGLSGRPCADPAADLGSLSARARPCRRTGRCADGFQRLWTPHRMAYIKGENKPSGPGRTRAARSAGSPRLTDAEGLIVARGDAGVRGAQPVPVQRRATCMVCPYRHVADYTELTAAETAELAELTKRAIGALRAGLRRPGLQHRHEPGHGRRRRHRRAPAPARRAPVGRRHQLHAGDRRTPRCCPSCWARPARCSPTPGRPPGRAAGRPAPP